MNNNYEITIKAYDRLGVLERILRVVRHRGSAIKEMQMRCFDDQQIDLKLLLASDKNPQLLQNQLRKLIDVISVEI